MSPQDASFLHIEDSASHMHIGSVAVFEGPAPEYDEFVRMVANKLRLVPRYRQKVKQVPLDLGRPVWVDDPHFRLDYHVRHTALPAPGGTQQLRALAGRVMSQRLDRSRPLWEMWVTEGLEDGYWALISKVHHCLVDGIAGTDLLSTMLDPSPEPSPMVDDPWRPDPEPSSARLAGEALIDYVASPYEQWRRARAVARVPRQALRQAEEVARGLSSLARMGQTPPSTLFGPIGPHRRYAFARGTLADVKTIRGAFGGTVNDVVLAVVTGGWRDQLIAHGDLPEEQVVRTLVPVSVRKQSDRGVYDNRVSAMFAELPVGVEDPIERLHAVSVLMERLKGSGQAVAAETLTSLSVFAPPLLFALGTRAVATAARRLGSRNVNTVTTNVPGPRQHVYAVGRKLVDYLPYVPITHGMRVGTAIFSYAGQLNFGVTADYDTVPDVHVLTDGIESGMAELVKAAETAGR